MESCQINHWKEVKNIVENQNDLIVGDNIIANTFNNYLINVGTSLGEHITSKLDPRHVEVEHNKHTLITKKSAVVKWGKSFCQ